MISLQKWPRDFYMHKSIGLSGLSSLLLSLHCILGKISIAILLLLAISLYPVNDGEPVWRVWHFATRFPVCASKNPGVPVCPLNISGVLVCTNYSHNLPRHRIPVFGDVRGRATGCYEVSKVVDRIKNELQRRQHVLKTVVKLMFDVTRFKFICKVYCPL